jgi:hypothetical protein
MKTRLGLLIGLVALIVMAVTPVLAHHSFDAEYDSTKTLTITGFVTKVDWVNPHAFVYFDSKDDKGVVRSFKLEMGPPYALQRGGWKKDTLKIGDKITVENAAMAKDGSNQAGAMQSTSMILASGQKMVTR